MKKYLFSTISSEFFLRAYSDYYFYSNIFRASELEFCDKFTKQEVCFNEDEFSDCQCPQSVLFQKVYTINFIGATSQSDAIGY